RWAAKRWSWSGGARQPCSSGGRPPQRRWKKFTPWPTPTQLTHILPFQPRPCGRRANPMSGETLTDDPVILPFPAAAQPRPAAGGDPLDLQTILAAWNQATDRLQRTHESLRAEVRRLTGELEAKNRELARKNRLADLGQMAAHVAHEVRNSLVPMKLYLSLLRRRISSDDGSLDVLEKIATGLTALEATVGDLLH